MSEGCRAHAADFIAGMTDRCALAEPARPFDAGMLDPIVC
jgi:dGTP triphosphohydrolase